MACARFSRREQACLCAEAHSAQLVEDFGKSQIDVPLDIFAEDPFRIDLPDDAGDIGPEMTGVVGAASLACAAEGLAGITGRDEMNAATPSRAVKGSQIVPNRRHAQGRVFHPRHESGRSVSFPLDKSHSPVPGFGDMQAEVEACISGAEGDTAQLRRDGGT